MFYMIINHGSCQFSQLLWPFRHQTAHTCMYTHTNNITVTKEMTDTDTETNPVPKCTLMEERCCIQQRSPPDCESTTMTLSKCVSLQTLSLDKDQSTFMNDINHSFKLKLQNKPTPDRKTEIQSFCWHCFL